MNENIKLVNPGILIKDYLDANGVTQTQLAKLTGYSEKQISLILNDKSPLTKAFAEALEEELPGNSAAFWLRYAEKFQEQELKEASELNGLDYKAWDSKFHLAKLFKKMPFIGKTDQINLVKDAIGINSLNDKFSHRFVYDNNVVFLRDESKCGKENREYLDLWLSVAVHLDSLRADSEKRMFVGKDALSSLLAKYKPLWQTTNSEQLIANISYFASAAGIRVILCNSAPLTYVRGATFPYKGEICIVLTNRFKTIEYVVFAFVHELMHITNGDVSLDKEHTEILDEGGIGEAVISGVAKNYFVSPGRYKELRSLCKNSTLPPRGKEMLFGIAREEKTTPGMLVTFLQHDKGINYSSFRECIHPFYLSTTT